MISSVHSYALNKVYPQMAIMEYDFLKMIARVTFVFLQNVLTCTMLCLVQQPTLMVRIN